MADKKRSLLGEFFYEVFGVESIWKGLFGFIINILKGILILSWEGSKVAVKETPGTVKKCHKGINEFRKELKKTYPKGISHAICEVNAEILAEKRREEAKKRREEDAKELAKRRTNEILNDFIRTAESGNAKDRYDLGCRYFQGLDGFSKNHEEALKWFKKAAYQAHIPAYNKLGEIYFSKTNQWEAFKWFKKAAMLGDAHAQYKMGEIYSSIFWDIVSDAEEAIKWFKKSAKQGNNDAMYMLGHMHSVDTFYGDNKDFLNDREAFRWYKKAAEQGHAEAQNTTGVYYARGCGVAQCYDEALKWCKKSAEQGNESGQHNFSDYESKVQKYRKNSTGKSAVNIDINEEPPSWLNEEPPLEEYPPWIQEAPPWVEDEIPNGEPPWIENWNVETLVEGLNQHGVFSLWHMTHKDNVERILIDGILSHTLAYKKIRPKDISDHGVQKWRESSDPFYGRKLHDYAPTYINIKNPMLFVRNDIQNELCLIEISLSVLSNDNYIFTDGNAASKNTNFYTSNEDLEKLPWEVLNTSFWSDFEDGKRKRCAEILIHPLIEPIHISTIHCCSHRTLEFLSRFDVHSKISSELFFENKTPESLSSSFDDDIPF